tara:strand:- start:1104 stop:1289 length:186 start_codon:yes stop_codon:yes gene_type:complete
MGYESLKRDIDWFTYSRVPTRHRHITGNSSNTLEFLVSSTIKRRVYYGISNLLRLGASDSI